MKRGILELCRIMGDFDVVFENFLLLLFRKLSCVKHSTWLYEYILGLLIWQ